MDNIMIHAVPGRIWWVEEYMIPQLMKSGVGREQITIWNAAGKGNLTSFIMAASQVAKDKGSAMWHLQDDVWPLHNFKEEAESLEAKAPTVYGFWPANQDRLLRADKKTGPFPKNDINTFGLHRNDEGYLWSFQCIRIPNAFYIEGCRWIEDAIKKNLFPKLIKLDKGDDTFFFEYLMTHHPSEMHWRCHDCLVEHVDTFMGGSILGHAIDQAGSFVDTAIVSANFREWMKAAQEHRIK